MARLNRWLTSMLLSVPLFLRSTMMPVYDDAPLALDGTCLPVLIFSHGLVGSMNTHSAILGELASHGVFCVALEHRDRSGALSLVRNGEAESLSTAPTEMSSVYYKSISLRIRPGVLEERDKQLQIRIFELMALYRALELLNEGETLKNLASSTAGNLSMPKGSLNLQPGSIIWGGHSFGGTTIIQLLKSVYYEGQCDLKQDSADISLLLQQPPPSLVAQITPLSPVALLDPWFMPLKSSSTKGLLCKPLPCHYATIGPHLESPSTAIVMSMEFAYHWPECHSHMPAIISPDPSSVRVQTQEEYETEFKKFTSPRDFMNKSKKARAATASQQQRDVTKDLLEKDGGEHQVSPIASYVLHDTTHVTHSDFGLLFQWVTWWVTGQKNPELAVQNTARCILAAAGLPLTEIDSDEARAQLERLS
ncbi:hypothetical protein H2200_010661 [Cladophialophora chaetospira]|uniref:1-alkyl-2-acetylglycerophosphocholine esterase n=1 Tax=Cladophialophora chaetospira TaxID=386627 RepID=A0AA38X0I2_9EURO|nr:hypothetical protein H2200_010661 [Cladophialophora chaetospira]